MPLPLFAQAPDAGPSTKSHALVSAARTIADRLSKGVLLSRQSLTAIVKEAVGGSEAWGDWSMRDAYDALEIAQVFLALSPETFLIDWTEPGAAFASRDFLTRRLPTQTYRTERQVDLQQFSTPLSLAWAAACAAQIREDDLVLEPSAGTGMLAVNAHQRGAELLLNERDPQRAELLSLALGRPVSCHDGEFIDTLLEDRRRPSLILINPPFSRSESRGRDRHAGARHLRAAMQHLAEGGRCVAIMSPTFSHEGSAASGYQAVADIVPPRWELTINGQPYAKHGTGISVRLLVFDKGWTGTPERHVTDTMLQAMALVQQVPTRLACPTDVPPVPPVPPVAALALPRLPQKSGTAGLLAGVQRARPAAPPRPVTEPLEPVPLHYELLDEPPAAGDPIGIYVPWRLTRVAIPGAKPHPDKLVESMAMSSILPRSRPIARCCRPARSARSRMPSSKR